MIKISDLDRYNKHFKKLLENESYHYKQIELVCTDTTYHGSKFVNALRNRLPSIQHVLANHGDGCFTIVLAYDKTLNVDEVLPDTRAIIVSSTDFISANDAYYGAMDRCIDSKVERVDFSRKD